MSANEDFHLWKVDLFGAALLSAGVALCLFPGFARTSQPLVIVAGSALIGTYFLRNVKPHFAFFQLTKSQVIRNCYLGAGLLSTMLYLLGQWFLS